MREPRSKVGIGEIRIGQPRCREQEGFSDWVAAWLKRENVRLGADGIETSQDNRSREVAAQAWILQLVVSYPWRPASLACVRRRAKESEKEEAPSSPLAVQGGES